VIGLTPKRSLLVQDPVDMAADDVTRLLDTYEAFVAGQLERIPEFFDPAGFYRTSGVFPGMKEVYRGHEEIKAFWHAANEPWELFEIEAQRTLDLGECVVAEVRFCGRGRGSGVEVTHEAGHLVKFRDRLIVEFSAFGSWEQALEAAPRHRDLIAQ
jgi:ketosteroid isomerase-like protein